MAAIRLRGFAGELPALSDFYLPDQNAARAYNIDLDLARLVAARGPLVIAAATTSASPSALFLYSPGVWFEWEEDADAAQSPVSNEAFGRAYFTKSDGPWVTDSTIYTTGGQPYPGSAYRPGVPTPTSAPTGTPGGSGSISETRYYVYCAVNEYGEIGPPSPVSAAVTMSGHANCSVAFSTVPDGDYNPVDKYFIYRTNSLGTAFQYVDEATSSPYVDTKTVLGEELPSTEWDPPPTDVTGLVSLPNGIQAAFRGNEVALSEPGLPHAWPVGYRKAVDHDIVALSAVDNGGIILTEGQPYLLIGVHPSSMAPVRLEVPYACSSKAGVVQFGESVAYPSPMGLVFADGSGARLITKNVIDLETWESFRPSTIRGFNFQDKYAAFYTSVNGTEQGFMFDPFAPEKGISQFFGVDVSAAYTDYDSPNAYIASDGNIALWNRGAPQAYQWRSKKYELPAPAAMNVVQVLADEYPVAVNIYRDGFLQATVEVGSPRPVRVPGARRGRNYQVEFVTTNSIHEAILASNMEELRRV